MPLKRKYAGLVLCHIAVLLPSYVYGMNEEQVSPNSSFPRASTPSTTTTTTTTMSTSLIKSEEKTKEIVIKKKTTEDYSQKSKSILNFRKNKLEDIPVTKDLDNYISFNFNEKENLINQPPWSYKFLIEKNSGEYKTIDKGMPKESEITKADKHLEKMCNDYKEAYNSCKSARKNFENNKNDKKLNEILQKNEKILLEIQIKFLRRRLINHDQIMILKQILESNIGLEFHNINYLFKNEILKIENTIFSSSEEKKNFILSDQTKIKKIPIYYVVAEEMEREIRAMEKLLFTFEREENIQQIVINPYNKDYKAELQSSWIGWFYDTPREELEKTIKNKVNESYPYGPYTLRLAPRGTNLEVFFDSIKEQELCLYLKGPDLYFKTKYKEEMKIAENTFTCTSGLGSKMYGKLRELLGSNVCLLSPADEWHLLNFSSLYGYLPDDLCVQATLRANGKMRKIQEKLKGRIKATEKPPLFVSPSGHYLQLLGESPDEESLKRLKPGELGVFCEVYKLKLLGKNPTYESLNEIAPRTLGLFSREEVREETGMGVQKTIRVAVPYCKINGEQEKKIEITITILSPEAYQRIAEASQHAWKHLEDADKNALFELMSIDGYVKDDIYLKVHNKEKQKLIKFNKQDINDNNIDCGYPAGSYEKILTVLKNNKTHKGLMRAFIKGENKEVKFSTSTYNMDFENLSKPDIDMLFETAINSKLIKYSQDSRTENVTAEDIATLEKLYTKLPMVGDKEECKELYSQPPTKVVQEEDEEQEANHLISKRGHYRLRLMGEFPTKAELEKIQPGVLGIFFERHTFLLMQPPRGNIEKKTLGIFCEDNKLYCKIDGKDKKEVQQSTNPNPIGALHSKTYESFLDSLKNSNLNYQSTLGKQELRKYLSGCAYIQDGIYCKIHDNEKVKIFEIDDPIITKNFASKSIGNILNTLFDSRIKSKKITKDDQRNFLLYLMSAGHINTFRTQWENVLPNLYTWISDNKKLVIDDYGKMKYEDEQDTTILYRFIPYMTIYPHRECMYNVLLELHKVQKPILETQEKQKTDSQYYIKKLEKHGRLYQKINDLLHKHISKQPTFDQDSVSYLGYVKRSAPFSAYQAKSYKANELPQTINLCGMPSLQTFSEYSSKPINDDGFESNSTQVHNMPGNKKERILEPFTIVNLSKNKINGVISTPFSQDLEELYISDNDLFSLRIVSNLKKLKILDASHNRISKLKELEGCASLMSLDLSYNFLERGLSLFSNNITYLNLSHNSIQSVEFLINLTKIIKLDISHNELKTLQPLSNLTTLTHLIASNNQLKGYVTQYFLPFSGPLYPLTLLQLQYCDLSENTGLSFCLMEDAEDCYKIYLPRIQYLKLPSSRGEVLTFK